MALYRCMKFVAFFLTEEKIAEAIKNLQTINSAVLTAVTKNATNFVHPIHRKIV